MEGHCMVSGVEWVRLTGKEFVGYATVFDSYNIR